MVFRFESKYFCFEPRSISNYVFNRSRVNSIVGRKASKPIMLELKPDASRDRPTLGPISNPLWLNHMTVRPSVKNGRRQRQTNPWHD